jgi:SAM-dependent methyltransferase
MNPQSGWDHPDTARYFEEFCRRHARYRNANRNLAGHARIRESHRIIDFGAGTGRTAEAALKHLGAKGAILCVEPAEAMRAVGMERLHDPRVSWGTRIPVDAESWDRVLCSAAIWQLDSLQECFRRFARVLSPAGALCFNVPSLYLGEAERPGGGKDPLLLSLPAILNQKRTSPPPQAGVTLRTAPQIDEMLRAAGLVPERWQVRARFPYCAYRDWLKIPVNTEGMFAGLPADARAALIDDAFTKVDQQSWRWEKWTGWTAWKGNG